jgi:hypothetical protein
VNDLRIESDPGPGSARASRPSPARLRRPTIDRATLPDDLRALIGGTVAVFLIIFWSVDDGGTDARTWYWGALVALASVALLLVLARGAIGALPRAAKVALAGFAL